jgi:hypothetical protein
MTGSRRIETSLKTFSSLIYTSLHMAWDSFSLEVKVSLEVHHNPKNPNMTHKVVHSLWPQTTTNVWNSYPIQTIARQSSFPVAEAPPPLKNAEVPHLQ